MKHFVTLLLLSFSIFWTNAQNIVFFKDIESQLSEQTSFFEGFYSLLTEDSTFLGGVYAITYYDACSNSVVLCLPENSEIPQYWMYLFDVKNNEIDESISNNIIIYSNDITYKVTNDNDYFYVTLKINHNGVSITYFGVFEIEDELD